ncbi:MAG: signal peptidase I [Candidatus Saccharimonadales bacterium]
MEPPLAQPPKLDNDQIPPIPSPAPRRDPEITEPEIPSRVQVHDADKHEGLRSILTTLTILILAPLIAFALTAFIFQSYQVDGSSMETTLQNQDRLIVLKLPRTWAKLTGHDYMPHRGDVIIFNKNDLYQYDGANQKKQLVKRVIGLPGDRVVVKDNEVTVYSSDHPHGFKPDKTMPYGKVIITTPGAVDLTVGPGQLYVMGDNRTNSLDSRIFGPISNKDIVGKLIFRIFPFNKAKKF